MKFIKLVIATTKLEAYKTSTFMILLLVLCFTTALFAQETSSYWLKRGLVTEDLNLKIIYFTKSIKLDPKNIESYYHRGFAYAVLANDYFDHGDDNLGLVKCDEAIKDFTKVIKINPKSDSAYCSRGKVFSTLSEYDKAIKDYTKAIELNSSNSEAYYLRGISKYLSGKEPLRDYTHAIVLNEFKLVECYGEYIDPNDYKKLLENMRKEERLKKMSARIYISRAFFYEKSGDSDRLTEEQRSNFYNEAFKDYNKAIKLDPENADAYYHRGLAFRRLNQKIEAADDFNKYLEIRGDKDGFADKVRQWIKELGFIPKY